MPETVAASGSAGQPPAELGYAQRNTNFVTNSTVMVDVTGLSVAVTIGVRKVVVELCVNEVDLATAAGIVTFQIYDVTGAAVVAFHTHQIANVGFGGSGFYHMSADLSPAGGARTYKVQMSSPAGNNATIVAAVGGEAYIRVREI